MTFYLIVCIHARGQEAREGINHESNRQSMNLDWRMEIHHSSLEQKEYESIEREFTISGIKQKNMKLDKA